jgi:hypothetical protein
MTRMELAGNTMKTRGITLADVIVINVMIAAMMIMTIMIMMIGMMMSVLYK